MFSFFKRARFFKRALLLCSAAAASFLIGCLGPDNESATLAGKNLELRFYPRFGNDTLKLAKKYRTLGGDSVRFEFARFYVSEISLIDSLGAEHPLTGLFLMDMFDSLAVSRGYAAVTIQARPGTYRGIRFSVGVPVDLNHRDAATQAAPLGVNAGMFWSWNSGYIFSRTEGKVDSAGVEKSIAYHIGEDARKLSVNLFALTGPAATTLQVSDTGGAAAINVQYDALFSRGLNTAGPLKPSLNSNERQAHMGALPNQLYLNSAAMFLARGTP
jgi:hypothetical protein